MTVYDIVTDRIIAALESGTVPWRKSWRSVDDLPKNLISGKAYRGINVWLLSLSGYTSPWWVTYKQARGLGGSVRKGEKATPVVYYSRIDTKDVLPDGSKKQAWILRYYSVFNVAQCDGITTPAPVVADTFVPIVAAQQIVEGMPHRPIITHGQGSAFYSPSADYVGMPDPGCFDTAENYHATLFHELVHSTGHASRLCRNEVIKTTHFGSSDYSREELVAELGSAYLCGHAGITATLPQHAAYLKGWIKALRGDSRLILQAASAAQKAADYILNDGVEGTEGEPEKKEED